MKYYNNSYLLKGFTKPARLVLFAKGGGLGKSAETLGEGSPEQVDAMTKFKLDIQETFQGLAEQAFPENPERQKEYAQQIYDSLVNHLAPGRTLEDLWKYLQSESCTIVAILKGYLNFYRTKDDKIDVNNYFNIGVTSAETPLDKEYSQKREALLETLRPQTKSAMMSFLDELKESHPDLPNYPS